MSGTSEAGEAAGHEPGINQAVAWGVLGDRLTEYLGSLGERDHLVLALPGPTAEPGAPYVSFGTLVDGRLYVGVPLAERLMGDDPIGLAGQELLVSWGFELEPGVCWIWSGASTESGLAACQGVRVLRQVFGVPHPALLSYDAVGPADAERLGLVAREDVNEEPDAPERDPEVVVHLPDDHDDLFSLVMSALASRDGQPPEVDEDGDIHLVEHGLEAWLRVRTDQPAIELLTAVVHEVSSPRQAAVEISIINREHTWVQWQLHSSSIWLRLMMPAYPFVPSHFHLMLDVYFHAMLETTADLSLRTRGRIA